MTHLIICFFFFFFLPFIFPFSSFHVSRYVFRAPSIIIYSLWPGLASTVSWISGYLSTALFETHMHAHMPMPIRNLILHMQRFRRIYSVDFWMACACRWAQISDIHQFYTRSHEHPIQVDDMEYKMASSSSIACKSIPTIFISTIGLAFNMICCIVWLTVHQFQ